MVQVTWTEREVIPSAQAHAIIKRLYHIYKKGVIPKGAISGGDVRVLQNEGFITSTASGDYKLTADGVMVGDIL